MPAKKAVAKKTETRAVMHPAPDPSMDGTAPAPAPAAGLELETPPPAPLVFVVGGTGAEAAATARALRLAKLGPIVEHRLEALSHGDRSPTERARLAMRGLMTADCVTLLPGFSRSRESALELMAAQAMGIPIVRLEELLGGGPIEHIGRVEIRAGVVMSGDVVTTDRMGHRSPPTFAPILPQKPTDPVHDSAGPGGTCTVCRANHLQPPAEAVAQ